MVSWLRGQRCCPSVVVWSGRRIRIGGPELSWWAAGRQPFGGEVGGDEPLIAVVCGSEGGTRCHVNVGGGATADVADRG